MTLLHYRQSDLRFRSVEARRKGILPTVGERGEEMMIRVAEAAITSEHRPSPLLVLLQEEPAPRLTAFSRRFSTRHRRGSGSACSCSCTGTCCNQPTADGEGAARTRATYGSLRASVRAGEPRAALRGL